MTRMADRPEPLGRWGYVWPVLAGAVHALSLSPWVAAWPGGAWPAVLQTLALAGLLWALALSASVRHGALTAWLYGSVWLIGATGWMFVSLHRFGGLPAWLSALAVYLLCVALSLYLAAAGAAWVRWRRHVWWADALLWSALWLLAELARAWLFTGFPWGASGYGLVDSALAGLAPWLGVYGLGAVWAAGVAAVVLWVVGPGRLGRPGRPVRPVLGAVLMALGLSGLAGWWGVPEPVRYTQPHGSVLSVDLLQSNVPQDHKFDPARQWEALQWHAQALRTSRADLVVAPETAIPLLPQQLPEGYWDALVASFQDDRHALIGLPLGDFEHGYTNSVAGLSAAAARTQPEGFYRYDKHHLVPFGEFIPWGFRWFVNLMNMPLGDFTRGPLVAPSFLVLGQRVAPTICYEDLFGEEVAARFIDPAEAPTILANVSNLAWFGETVAIHQHLHIARMRSLEFQLPTVRSTNTGATVVIDHRGQVQAALPGNTRGVLQARVQGHQGVTPFAWWAARWGLGPLVLLAALVVALAVCWPRRDVFGAAVVR